MFAARAPWWSYFTSSCCGTCSSGEVHRGVELLGIAKALSAPADENITAAPVVSCVATAPAGYAVPFSVVLQPCATTAPVAERRVSVEAVYISPASAVIGSSAPEVEYVALAPAVRSNHAMCTPRHYLSRSWRRPQPVADCCCGSRDVAASLSQTAVGAVGTLRRHTPRLLLRQHRRCGVNSQTAVAAAETLRRHTLRLLLRQQTRRHTRRLLLRQQRRCSFQNSPMSSGGDSEDCLLRQQRY